MFQAVRNESNRIHQGWIKSLLFCLSYNSESRARSPWVVVPSISPERLNRLSFLCMNNSVCEFDTFHCTGFCVYIYECSFLRVRTLEDESQGSFLTAQCVTAVTCKRKMHLGQGQINHGPGIKAVNNLNCESSCSALGLLDLELVFLLCIKACHGKIIVKTIQQQKLSVLYLSPLGSTNVFVIFSVFLYDNILIKHCYQSNINPQKPT